jgi:AraC-like DNA-binding protein/ligand-binding sensor protein
MTSQCGDISYNKLKLTAWTIYRKTRRISLANFLVEPEGTRLFETVSEGIEKRLNIDKIIDKQLLQRLLNSFSTATGLFVAVTDADGECLLSSDKVDCDFCRLVKANALGLERCRGSYARAGKQAEKWNEPYFFRCHAGLITWACPIVSNNVHVGNIICGQVMLWEPEDLFWQEIDDLTREFEPDNRMLLDAAHTLEIVSAHQVQAAADLLYIIANHLTQSGTDLLNYQHKLRSVGSWLWVNYRQQEQQRRARGGLEPWSEDLESEIFKAIRIVDVEKAKQLLDRLALQIFTHSKGQLEVLKGLSMEFVISLGRFATECGVKFEESFRRGMIKFKELEDSDTTEKVFVWLLAMGNAYIDMLTQPNLDENEAVIKKAVSYIQERYAAPSLSIEEVAGVVYISPTHLSRMFKQQTGCSILEYIRNTRLEQAKLLLRHSNKTASQVAKCVGYNDRTYFCKVFKQITGISPNEYRRKNLLL